MLNNLRSNKLIDLLKEICFLSIIFFTPLYFALFLKNNNVFELNKLVLFKILVLILLFLSILKYIWPSRSLPLGDCGGSVVETSFLQSTPQSSAERLRQGVKYIIIPAIFLLFLSISTIFSINREVGFYGLSNRLQGLSSYLYYFLFFILLLINVKSKEQINKIVLAIVFSSFLVSIYGLIQAFGFDPLPWGESSKLRIFSTFGQPNLLSSYLLLTMPLSLYLIFKNNEIIFKILCFIILLSQLLCLFFTYSLSGWLGFFIGGILTSATYFFLSSRPFLSFPKP